MCKAYPFQSLAHGRAGGRVLRARAWVYGVKTSTNTKTRGVLDPLKAYAIKEVYLIAREGADGTAGEKREHGIGKVQGERV